MTFYETEQNNKEKDRLKEFVALKHGCPVSQIILSI